MSLSESVICSQPIQVMSKDALRSNHLPHIRDIEQAKNSDKHFTKKYIYIGRTTYITTFQPNQNQALAKKNEQVISQANEVMAQAKEQAIFTSKSQAMSQNNVQNIKQACPSASNWTKVNRHFGARKPVVRRLGPNHFHSSMTKPMIKNQKSKNLKQSQTKLSTMDDNIFAAKKVLDKWTGYKIPKLNNKTN